ncbi:MAG: cytochrome c oxidase subunit I [Ardenticatenaceae bacterium]|nr:cytochrome c oxidase subunit I [Ardenticatenaceae bacterium]HBY96885.1 cytochrome c oxidase subunit I [Chloroflexota bacterium]
MATQVGTFPIPRRTETGLWSWLTTVDHKRIGIVYMASALLFFLLGGIEALIIRWQLAQPNGAVVSPQVYNEIFTMHGTTMIFLFVMPFNVGLGNYIVPLMIGARDMAFPRLNALSLWLFLLGGLVMNASFLFGGAPAMGWFAYAPLTLKEYSQTMGVDFWIMGIQLTGIASILGALNFVVTILRLRAPGMSINRMPLFVWTTLVTAFMLLFALPSLTVAAILLYLDRHFGTGFFNPALGGDPLLWQHLFWFFGHPEVYIMILPPMGIISEVLPVFSRKPIFGYTFVAWSTVAIGFLGFGVYAHHMFAVGLPGFLNTLFAGVSMLIAVPTAVKIFNWIATLWGGRLHLTTAMLFGISFPAMFVIGGLSGIFVAVVPLDWQVHDTYFIVAHFHYVLFGGALLGLFAGIYYWFPKITGRLLDERQGKIHFWLTMVGFNLTFFPMHILGLLGMPRRIYTYPDYVGWGGYNLLETIGAVILAVSVLVFFWNLVSSLVYGAEAGDNPWDGWTLEWATPSPPPVYNFAEIPVVKSRRPLWESRLPSGHVEEG